MKKIEFWATGPHTAATMTISTTHKFFFSLLLCLPIFSRPAFCDLSPVTIGLMTELSGASAPNGALCRSGFEVARRLYAPGDRVGTHAVRFVYGDTQGQGPAGISEFKRLTEAEKAIAVVLNRSSVGMAVNPISATKGVPLIGIVGHAAFTDTNRFAYRFWPTAKQEGEAIAQRILADGLKTVSVLTTEDQWTISLTEAFLTAFKAGGGSVVFEERIEPENSDFMTIMTQLRRKATDGVLLNLNLAHIGTALKRLQDAGVKAKLYANYWANNPDAAKVAGAARNGVVFDEPDPRAPRFEAGLIALSADSKPEASSYTCYLGLAALLRTLAVHPKIRDAASLNAALSSQQEIELLDGPLKFNGRDAQIPIRFGVL